MFLAQKSFVVATLLVAAELISVHASTVDVTDGIQSMALYLSDRLPRELAALMVRKQASTVEIEDLLAFDQMHYEGENAMISAISSMEITSSSRILDIGSGYGGPARYVSWKTGAFVTALELQPEISGEAQKMTSLVGRTKAGPFDNNQDLEFLVDHQVGNIISWGPNAINDGSESIKYDGFMSMLAFLHVDDKKALFTSIGHTLKPGARFYIEDYFERAGLTDEDISILRDIVSCGALPSQSEYVKSLELAGFSDINFVDKTEDWAVFVAGRHEIFIREKESRTEVLGDRTYNALDLFYSSVAKLFHGGRLGGTVITGTYRGPSSRNGDAMEEL